MFRAHLTLDIQGYRCDTKMLFNVLTKAALENGSLQLACDDLDGVADGNTLREHLNDALDVADLQLYGKTLEMQAYTCRDRAKKGITHFFRITSASVLWRGIRLTLALNPTCCQNTARRLLSKQVIKDLGKGFQRAGRCSRGYPLRHLSPPPCFYTTSLPMSTNYCYRRSDTR